MLKIKQNFTTKQYSPKVVHFKGQNEITEDYVNEQKAFYQEQIDKADKIIEDKRTPSFLKKFMKVSKIISEGFIDGWAVLFGALTGAQVVKKGALKSVNSKAAKNIGSGFKKIGTVISKGFKKLADSGVAKKAVDFASQLVEKLNNTKYGKYIVKAGKAVVNFIKSAVGITKKGVDKITKPLKEKGAEAVYDKTSKGVATTLGVGSGVAGTYSAAKKAEQDEHPERFANIEGEDFSDEEYDEKVGE